MKKKITFKEFLMETPIDDYKTFGDFSKGSSFRDKRDRFLIQNPRTIENVKKKFANTDHVFNFYFVNSAKANNHTEVGVVTADWVREKLGEDIYKEVAAKYDQDSINVIFTNNKGSERKNLTGWMMAHRLGHAMARKGEMRDRGGQYEQASDCLISNLSNIMSYYGQNNFPDNDRSYHNGLGSRDNRKYQLTMIHFFQKVCTFRSARENSLRDWFEVLNELIAQYLKTGKIKFNKAPQSFGGKDKYYTKPENLTEIDEMLETLSRDMTYVIDGILSSVTNRILVM